MLQLKHHQPTFVAEPGIPEVVKIQPFVIAVGDSFDEESIFGIFVTVKNKPMPFVVFESFVFVL